MIETIKPLKVLPEKINIGGDYGITQSSLMLGVFCREKVRLYNYNLGRDTFRTIEFLNSLGIGIERNATEITISPVPEPDIPECAELTYDGGVLPLVLIIGFLAGRNQCCTLKYSQVINQDLIDTIVQKLNRLGIDIFHEADECLVVFRTSRPSPIECSIDSGLPYEKQILLMIGLTARLSVAISEHKKTDDYFEKMIERMGGNISIEEARTKLVEDPEDPRKKIRIGEADCKRKIILLQLDSLEGAEIEVPADYHCSLAVIILAVLKKASLTLLNIPSTEKITRFSKYLNSIGVEIEIRHRRQQGDFVLTDISVKGGAIKARRIPDDMASLMMEELPYISILSALGGGNTIIRGVKEFAEWRASPFAEISEALKTVGIKAGAIDDGLVVEGGKEIESDIFGPFQNRETALGFYMVALSLSLPSKFNGFEIIRENYPELVDTINDIYEKQLLLKMGV